MQKKGNYQTKHYQQIRDYLKEAEGEHLTVYDIRDHFASEKKEIGLTTIYRQLDKLVESGEVKKYQLDTMTSACYEYINTQEHCHKDFCFHAKCIQCGRMIHMHCHELLALQEHMKEHHEFLLDPSRTLFFGICSECAKKGETI